MRKYIFLVLILGSWILTSTSYAAICPTPTNPNAVCADTTTNTTQGVNMTINADGSYTPINSTAQSSTPTAGGPTKVIVTEKVPGANCKCYVGGNAGGEDCPTGTKVEDRKYICEVDKGLVAFQKMFAQIVRWVVNIVMLLGVLAIVGAGILWAWGSESEEQTKKAKGWVINIIIGLAILFTFRYILGFLAPWIFK